MNKQLEHEEVNTRAQKFPVTLVCDGISSAANTGAIFRISEAMGVRKLYFCGVIPVFNRRMQKTSRSTHEKVDFEYRESTEALIRELKDQGFYIVALEITSNSISLRNFKLPENMPLALILGAENHGVSENTLRLTDRSVHIEMYGENSSMNAGVAAGIALYEISSQLSTK
ncbi:TrmH family RNA methyltransferase [Robertkochia solimangrovi]|uniref:TrmH family RNA methyltransferase n=1 Tax=Robertkochia solimangrovi TaxID=2213046 RepID=UPI001180575D|nr:TrmH family RNA methyltransferase [Robertkochia solimangrovi]TRZ42508.1 TrmH family RNA methyltransferase [Robertkochia solimangrovi]